MDVDGTELTRSHEDYLEAIYRLKLKNREARIKDIATAMKVTMPSASEAVSSLAARGLVTHKPYESVELTDRGLELARHISYRHSAVKDFLVNVLGLPGDRAEEEACGIEHAIDPDTLDRLIKFSDFARACGTEKSLRLDHFQHYMRHGSYPEQGPAHPPDGRGHGHPHLAGRPRRAISSFKLSELRPGDKARVAFVSGGMPIRRKLMEMGLTSDAVVEVVRTAPLGDPIQIKVRGYCLSLRKSEADRVEVEVID